jgi:hypothetical protein
MVSIGFAILVRIREKLFTKVELASPPKIIRFSFLKDEFLG